MCEYGINQRAFQESKVETVILKLIASREKVLQLIMIS